MRKRGRQEERERRGEGETGRECMLSVGFSNVYAFQWDAFCCLSVHMYGEYEEVCVRRSLVYVCVFTDECQEAAVGTLCSPAMSVFSQMLPKTFK